MPQNKFLSSWTINRFSRLGKNKEATANSTNKNDNKCFQCSTTVALKNEEIGKDPQRTSKIEPFINKYN